MQVLKIIAVLDTPSEIKEAKNAVVLKDVKGRITFEDVSFKYQTGGMVLRDIFFDAKPGQMIALVGPTSWKDNIDAAHFKILRSN